MIKHVKLEYFGLMLPKVSALYKWYFIQWNIHSLPKALRNNTNHYYGKVFKKEKSNPIRHLAKLPKNSLLPLIMAHSAAASTLSKIFILPHCYLSLTCLLHCQGTWPCGMIALSSEL